jgi:hypothetical protein
MPQVNSLYKHKILGYTCTTTQVKGGWVEFFTDPDSGLRWLEDHIFLEAHAFQHVLPVTLPNHEVDALRDQASARGILIPREILANSQST